MRSITDLAKDLDTFSNKVIDNVIKAQRATAREVCTDVIDLAPGNGEYTQSIKIGDTKVDKGVIKTRIYTDLKSEDGYYIGRMIEHGTGIYALEPHIGHTDTFKLSGYRFWYVPATSVKRQIGAKVYINGNLFYLAKPQVAKPHFKPALDKNHKIYMINIRKAIDEAKKWEL